MSKLLADPQQRSMVVRHNDDAAASSAKGVVRHVLVNITGNRTVWNAAGQTGAMWRVNPEQAAAIFSTADGSTDERLQRALIKRVVVLESNTNIDEIVAVTVEGLPPKEFTANGDGASLFLTGEGRVHMPQEIFNFSNSAENGIKWMQKFPRYTSDNIEKEGMMILKGSTTVFLEEDHPVVWYLREHEEEYGTQIGVDSMMEGEWHRVDEQLFRICVQNLRNDILRDAPSTFDLTSLTVRLSKPDRQGWLHFPPCIIDTLIPPEIIATGDPDRMQCAKIQALQRFMERPLSVTLRLAIEYVLPRASRDGCT